MCFFFIRIDQLWFLLEGKNKNLEVIMMRSSHTCDFLLCFNCNWASCCVLFVSFPAVGAPSCCRYFAQILEEHGPLVDEDRLLVGELANFPAEARRKIAEAGGLESFLLESLRFIKIGRRIGLTRHAVGPRPAASLDDLDDIVDPRLDAASPDPYILGDFSDYLSGFCFPVAGPQPVLPNPYSFYPAGSDAAPAWSDIDCGFIANGYAEPHLDTLDDIYEQLERDPAPQRSVLSSEASRCRSDAAVQVKAAAGPAVPQRVFPS